MSTLIFTAINNASLTVEMEELTSLIKTKGVDFKGTRGNTALSLAALLGYKGVVKFLLDKKANINIKNQDGNNPLMLAAQNGHKEVAELLLQYDCDLNLKNSTLQTALLIAVKNNQDSIANLLLNNKADYNLKDYAHQTPFSVAVDNGNELLINRILRQASSIKEIENLKNQMHACHKISLIQINEKNIYLDKLAQKFILEKKLHLKNEKNSVNKL